MVDPDIPAMSCNNLAFVRHWLVTNVSGLWLKWGCNNIERIPGVLTMQTYLPPGAVNGIHRYQFFIFEEFNCPLFGKIPISTADEDSQIISFEGNDYEVHWSVTKFAINNQLRVVAGFEWRIDTGIPDQCPNSTSP